MMNDRLSLSRNLMSQNSGIWVSSDDGEYAHLKFVMDGCFGNQNFIADVIWNSRKSVSNDALISGAVNHTTFFAKDKTILDNNKKDFRLPESTEGFANPDNDPRGLWKLDPLDAPNIRANLSYGIINPKTGKTFFPPEGRCWRFEEKTVKEYLKDGRILFGKTGKNKPAFKRFYEDAKEKGRTTKTLWDDVGTTSNGTDMLHNLFQNTIPKEELNKIKPKPLGLMQRVFQLHSDTQSIYLDFFAGSGSTAHAVIDANRNGSQYKYIIIEQGEYFNTVLKPRVQKVIYSKAWKDGKPQADDDGNFHGVPQIVKVLKLESYEDTLNNLQLKKPDLLTHTLNEQTAQDYLLHYMLDMESRDSLLSTDDFRKPFDYRLNIASDSAGAYTPQVIDLVETFNYLLGLRVDAVEDRRYDKGYVFMEGHLEGEPVLLVWRDCERWNYDGLQQLLEKKKIKPQDSEYAAIYINGDHTLPTVWQDNDADGGSARTLKIRSIEAEFLRLMFAEAE